jgi:hypothetical protein
MSTEVTHVPALPDKGIQNGEIFFFIHDQICFAIALLEIEHKKFPTGAVFNLRSEKRRMK